MLTVKVTVCIWNELNNFEEIQSIELLLEISMEKVYENLLKTKLFDSTLSSLSLFWSSVNDMSFIAQSSWRRDRQIDWRDVQWLLFKIAAFSLSFSFLRICALFFLFFFSSACSLGFSRSVILKLRSRVYQPKTNRQAGNWVKLVFIESFVSILLMDVSFLVISLYLLVFFVVRTAEKCCWMSFVTDNREYFLCLDY